MHNLGLPMVIVVAAVLVVALVIAAWFVRRRQRRIKIARLQQRWQAIQKQCAQPKQWPAVVLDADALIDDSLKTLGFRGRSMGERLVSAQRKLTDNDSIWFSHKLRNKISQDELSRLYKKDVQAALRGVRQALMDLGVLL